ncbi:MAG: molybdopterin-dependent oxidoreductase [Anaerolineae bacterium]|nr:molybdopterin-dependent oxidoreductase [Anaerolineae bacterium]
MAIRQRIGAPTIVQTQFWSFSIIGMVQHVAIWSHAEITTLPRQSVTALVACSAESHPTQEVRVSVWRGVPLSTLLSSVQIAPAAHFARLHCADGFTSLLPREMLDRAVLALEPIDVPPSPDDGCPARLVVPGCCGYKQAKWLERIEMIAAPVGGMWEERGASLDGRLQATSSFRSAPEGDRLRLSGTAFALGGFSEIQMSIGDGGWMPLSIAPVLTDDGGVSAVDWNVVWTPPHTGNHTVRLRLCPAQGGAPRSIVRNVTVP